MRKIILFNNISLDGYFEDQNHDISGFKADFEAFSSSEGSQVDTLLFGHKTYEMMKFWSTPQAEAMAPDVAKFMNATQKIVASHEPFAVGWNNVRVISGDIPAAVRQIKEEPGKDIMIFGSNTLSVSLMQEGLIDEFQIVVNPVAFGAGTPLFAGLRDTMAFHLLDVRRFSSGAVLLIYRPAV